MQNFFQYLAIVILSFFSIFCNKNKISNLTTVSAIPIVQSIDSTDNQLFRIVFDNTHILQTSIIQTPNADCKEFCCKPNYYINFANDIQTIISYYMSNIPNDSSKICGINIPIIEDYYFYNIDSAQSVFTKFYTYLQNFDLAELRTKEVYIVETHWVLFYKTQKKVRIIKLANGDFKKFNKIYNFLQYNVGITYVAANFMSPKGLRYFKSNYVKNQIK